MKLSDIKQHLKKQALGAVQTLFKIEGIDLPVGIPPQIDMGDFTVETFPLAKPLKMGPPPIAAKIAEAIKPDEIIASVNAAGPYINFKINPAILFQSVVDAATNPSEPDSSNQKIMVEYLSPNTNKPLHLGHLRNGSLGMAMANIFSALGHDVIKASIINDRGVHICKSLLAWQKWGNGAPPESTGKKGDHFVGEWYVRYSQEEKNNPALADEAQALLRKWEQNDPQVRKDWAMMRQWVLDGFNQTYKILGFTFDKEYFESDVYEQGRDIVEEGLATGVFRKNDKGNVVFDLPPDEFGLDENGQPRLMTVLRPDGTSLYTTQDLGLAVRRATEFKLSQLIYVVGSEQVFHFQTLFAMIKALGYDWAKNLHHLSYGMVLLPEGKMKSREGTVVDADDLVMEMKQFAREEIAKRDTESKLPAEEIDRRSLIIGLAAIKFYLLRTKATNDISFDPKESIAFEGFTGPYCQYTYARAQSIVRQAGESRATADYSKLGNGDERALVRQLGEFDIVLEKAARAYNPAALATHVFETAQAFNQFYGSSPVIKAEAGVKEARLALVKATAGSIKKGLELLGIETLEEM